MKEILIEDIIELNDKTTTLTENESRYEINIFNGCTVQTIRLLKNLSNLDTVNKLLAVFDYTIVKPLIDFSKPLAEELRRLANKSKVGIEYRYYVYYNYKNSSFCCKEYSTQYDEKLYIGCPRFYNKDITFKVLDYLNNNKENALKAMEL